VNERPRRSHRRPSVAGRFFLGLFVEREELESGGLGRMGEESGADFGDVSLEIAHDGHERGVIEEFEQAHDTF